MKDYRIDTNRLKKLRESAGYTKHEMAKLIGVSQPAYLRYEAGERTPSRPVINAIAAALGTSPEYITGASRTKKATVYTVAKADEPELFGLIENFRKLDEKKAKKALTQIAKLAE